MRAAACIVAITLLTCTPRTYVADTANSPPTVPVFVDSRFTGETKGAIRLAIDEWNIALGNHLRFYVDSETLERPSHDPIVDLSRLWTDSLGVTIDWEPPDCLHCRWTNDIAWVSAIGGTDIHLVMSRADAWDVKAIIEHEFGHVLGLEHTAEPDELMTTYLEHQARCIDADTVAQVAKVHGWEVTRMVSLCP